jgi:hypothetical protein
MEGLHHPRPYLEAVNYDQPGQGNEDQLMWISLPPIIDGMEIGNRAKDVLGLVQKVDRLMAFESACLSVNLVFA